MIWSWVNNRGRKWVLFLKYLAQKEFKVDLLTLKYPLLCFSLVDLWIILAYSLYAYVFWQIMLVIYLLAIYSLLRVSNFVRWKDFLGWSDWSKRRHDTLFRQYDIEQIFLKDSRKGFPLWRTGTTQEFFQHISWFLLGILSYEDTVLWAVTIILLPRGCINSKDSKKWVGKAQVLDDTAYISDKLRSSLFSDDL